LLGPGGFHSLTMNSVHAEGLIVNSSCPLHFVQMLKDFLIYSCSGISKAAIKTGYYAELAACLLQDKSHDVAVKEAKEIIIKYAQSIKTERKSIDVKVTDASSVQP
jgi:hypothetical protein